MINKLNNLKKYFDKNNFTKEADLLGNVVARTLREKPEKKFYFVSLRKNKKGAYVCINFEYQFITSDKDIVKDLTSIAPELTARYAGHYVYLPEASGFGSLFPHDKDFVDNTGLIPSEVMSHLKSLGWSKDSGSALGMREDVSFKAQYIFNKQMNKDCE